MKTDKELKQTIIEGKKDDGLNNKQREAVYIRGANILVSAGAGSGKTYVLTKRVISLLTDENNPIDVDRLFVATFTVSATGEMKERIRKAINGEIKDIRDKKICENNPDRISVLEKQEKHLKKQISLLNRASITTIDSFCSTVVKQNFQKLVFETDEETLSLDPNFKICEEWESEQIKQEAMDEFMEIKYQEKNADFMSLCDNLCQNYSDENLRNVIISVLKKIENFSNREKWFEKILSMYHQLENIDNFYKSDFAKEYRKLYSENIDDSLKLGEIFLQKSKTLVDRLSYLKTNGKLTATIENAIVVYENIEKFISELKECSTNEDNEKNQLKIEAKEISNTIKNYAKIFRENVFEIFKKEYKTLPLEVFYILKEQAPLIVTLIDCIKEYDKILLRKKFEQQKYTFNDIARFCHDILVDENGDKTAVAERYAENFAEVIVDEYQDISFLQDDILQAISNGHNLFMVGDIKQAIYRFR